MRYNYPNKTQADFSTYNLGKAPHRYAVQVSDTTMMTIGSVPVQQKK